MNQKLLIDLQKLLEIAGVLGQVYREKAYRKAIDELQKLEIQITQHNIDAVSKMKIPGIGAGIMGKIREFVDTGSIREVVELASTPQYKAHQCFTKMIGVGPVTAKSWVDMQIYTLSDLRKAVSTNQIKLNHMQKCGLKYYNDLNSRIPHDEITIIAGYVKANLLRINPHIIFNVAGSYRRNTPTSGDVDILISTPRDFDKVVLKTLVEMLSNDPRYVATLSTGAERVTFVYKSPASERVRQIDVLNLPYDRYWSGILYFTGSFQTNIAMRAWAKQKGYRLNQNGLWRVLKNEKMQLVPARTEREIFDLLGLKYVDPTARIDHTCIVPIHK